jgi:hypothetical protein
VITPSLRVNRPVARVFFSGFLLVVIFGLALSRPTGLFAAQKHKAKPYALIAGTVWGPDDRPVFGVKVKIRRAKDKKPKWEIYSDHMGEFAQRVPAGESDYILWADLKDFKLAEGKPVHLVQEVMVHIYSDEREDTGLHLAY